MFLQTSGLIGRLLRITRLEKIQFESCVTSRCDIHDAKVRVALLHMWESGDTNFLKPNGQSRNLNIYGYKASSPLHPVLLVMWRVVDD